MNSYSATPWFSQVLGFTTFICLGLASGSLAAITINPTAMTYYAGQGATHTPDQTITVSRTSTWQATLTASNNVSWLSFTPGSGSHSGTLTTSVNTAGLAAGNYNGTITVAAAGAASKTVWGTLTVNPQATSSATCSRNPITTDANRNPDQNGAGYQVNRAIASGAYGALIDATKQCYVATGLQVSTTYLVVIMAYNISENDSQTFR